MFLKESLPGCKGIWTVYHKNLRSDSSKGAADEDEYHAYLIISLENRTMVYHPFLLKKTTLKLIRIFIEL